MTLEDYEGLGRRSPAAGRRPLTIFLLSLIGIPIDRRLLAKFYVFSAAVKSEFDLA